MLQRAYADFYARTTHPPSLIHLEPDSKLYGVTSIRTIVMSQQAVILVEKEHWSRYGTFDGGLCEYLWSLLLDVRLLT